jgi:predicted nucleotidyltransferase
MRLTHIQKQVICERASKYFGADAHVWLFGSRVDDDSKGGDIDLYIESQSQDAAGLITAKLQFLREGYVIVKYGIFILSSRQKMSI